MPGAFQLISDLRNFRNVVRNGDGLTTGTGEHGEISRGRQVRTKHPPAPDFQFDAKQRVMNSWRGALWQSRELVRARAHSQNSVAIDSWKPRVAHFGFDC